MTAAQVGARPDTWTPTASEVGAVPAAALDAIEEYLVQEANTYTDAQVKNAAPRNLLINSDFRNPVNSNGKSSYTGNAYSIDKWRAYHANTTHTVIPGEGITVSATDANSNLYQQLDTTHIDVTRVMTAAACDSDGNIYIWTGIASTSSHKNGACVYISNGNYLFRLTISKTVTWKWAALYYGEYTLDTLPEYQPKGYETELLICRQYDSTSGEYIGLQKFGRPHNLLDNSYWENVNSIVNQKGQSSYSGNVYTIDRWYGRVAAQTLTVRGADITVTSTTGGSYAGILQKIENISAYAGKTITLACKVYSTKPVAVGFADASDTSALKETVDNVSNTRIIICSYTVPSGATTDTVIPRLLLRSTAANDYMRLYWAALYEGEYTLDTLPEYQPKGYGAELAECQRHYITLTGSLGYQALGCAVAISTTQVVIPLFLPVSLRTPNISLDVSDITKFHLQGENNIDIADMYVSRVNNTIIKLVCTASSALAAGKSYVLSNGANADAVLAISANFL